MVERPYTVRFDPKSGVKFPSQGRNHRVFAVSFEDAYKKAKEIHEPNRYISSITLTYVFDESGELITYSRSTFYKTQLIFEDPPNYKESNA